MNLKVIHSGRFRIFFLCTHKFNSTAKILRSKLRWRNLYSTGISSPWFKNRLRFKCTAWSYRNIWKAVTVLNKKTYGCGYVSDLKKIAQRSSGSAFSAPHTCSAVMWCEDKHWIVRAAKWERSDAASDLIKLWRTGDFIVYVLCYSVSHTSRSIHKCTVCYKCYKWELGYVKKWIYDLVRLV